MRVSELRKRWLGRKQIACLLLAALFAGAAEAAERKNAVLSEDAALPRSGYGGSRTSYALMVEGVSEEAEMLTVTVSPRQYTEAEAQQQFTALMELLPALITGENESLQEVRTDLMLPVSAEGFEGIRLSWFPEDPALIEGDGAVQNGAIKESRETALRLMLTAGAVSQEYRIPICIYPPEPESAEARRNALQQLLLEADAKQAHTEFLQLPQTVDGVRLTYRREKSRTPLFVLGLGILSAGLIGLQPEEARRQEKKRRDAELLLDYAELLSKLMVYIGAGLTIRNAWCKITEVYETQLAQGIIERRCVYEEMRRTRNELEQGASERRAYLDFAHRCELRCYMRLGTLLEQQRQTGDRALRSLLMIEMQEAFEQRKNAARRLGEEAGTKLTGPLMLSLIAILLIVIAPAMLTLQ